MSVRPHWVCVRVRQPGLLFFFKCVPPSDSLASGGCSRDLWWTMSFFCVWRPVPRLVRLAFSPTCLVYFTLAGFTCPRWPCTRIPSDSFCKRKCSFQPASLSRVHTSHISNHLHHFISPANSSVMGVPWLTIINYDWTACAVVVHVPEMDQWVSLTTSLHPWRVFMLILYLQLLSELLCYLCICVADDSSNPQFSTDNALMSHLLR